MLLTVASAGRRRSAQCHSKAAVLCNRPHGWKGVALRCRRSPRSELEVFCARNEFKVLASGSCHFAFWTAALRPPRPAELQRSTPDHDTYPESQLRQQLQPRDECNRSTLPEQGSHKEQSARKAPSTRKRCRAPPPDRRRPSARALEEHRRRPRRGARTRSSTPSSAWRAATSARCCRSSMLVGRRPSTTDMIDLYRHPLHSGNA